MKYKGVSHAYFNKSGIWDQDQKEVPPLSWAVEEDGSNIRSRSLYTSFSMGRALA